MAWRIEVLGETFSEWDYNPTQAAKLEEACGVRWGALNSRVLSQEINVTRRLAAHALAFRKECDVTEAYELLDTMSARELLESVSDYDDLPTEYAEGFPTPADDPSTIT